MILIINADDYGLTSGTNRGIERAHVAGTVTSTSVMVNQCAWHDVASLRQRHPAIGIGIHLTLTLGDPTREPSHVRSLVDLDGRLIDRREFVRRLRDGRLDVREVALECEAQLRLLRSAGVEPDHWNVHQHLQEYPPIGSAVARAMSDAGVDVARNPRRVRTRRVISPGGLRAHLEARGRRAGCEAVTAASRTPRGLLDAPPRSWAGIVPFLAGGVFEAICHPSEPDDRLPALTPDLVAGRMEELAALLSPELRRALRQDRVRLSTFAAEFGP